MQKMQCELCGSVDIMKVAPDVFQCQHCGCKYTLEQAKTLISGTVEITKGKAEMERLLANAEAQIRFGAYAKAEDIFKNLTDEYPGEHKVWANFNECRRSALLNGYRTLDDQELNWFRVITKNAAISAESEEERNHFLADTEAFWQQFVMMDYASAKPMINLISAVRFVFGRVIGEGEKPEDCIDRSLWDYIAMRVRDKINSGELLLYTSDYDKSAKAIYYIQELDIELYLTAINNLSKIHPLFAEIVEAGYTYATDLNNGAVRLAHHYGVTNIYKNSKWSEYQWLPNGHPEIKPLYVVINWAYGTSIFGTQYYVTNYNYTQKRFTRIDREFVLLDEIYAEMVRDRKVANDIIIWNKSMGNCPFCSSANISDGLFGRKCRACGKPIPKFK